MHTRKTWGRSIALVLAAVLLIGGLSAVPALGVTSATVATPLQFTTGYVEMPGYVLNDHTGYGVRFGTYTNNAKTTWVDSGLQAGDYYYKAYLTDTQNPDDATIVRGFSWNEATQKWVREDSAWSEFGTLTVTPDTVTGEAKIIDNMWVRCKVGDENISPGTYYVQIALRPVSGGDTYYQATPVTTTVLDAETDGSWIHNGTTPPDSNTWETPPTKLTDWVKASGKRLAIRGSDASTTDGDPNNPDDAGESTLISLWELQLNLVDDDTNGVVDDEDYGPLGETRTDYRIGVPIDTIVDVYVHRADPSKGGWMVDDFETSIADCDIAVSSGSTIETVPPTAVADFTAVANGPVVNLAWTATGDSGGSGLAGYYVYRWEPTTGLAYTPVKTLIATLAADETSYTDADVSYGAEYMYEIRSFDGATNVGPRDSAAVTVASPTMLSVYRFFNRRTGTHFYTISETEKADVLAKWPDIFTLEGVAYTPDPWKNTAPLYRFFNKRTGTHFYTISETEKADVLAKWPDIFTLEGVAYNVSVSGPETPVYRFYNNRTGAHFYTASEAEKADVLAKWPDIFTLEGIAFYIAN